MERVWSRSLGIYIQEPRKSVVACSVGIEFGETRDGQCDSLKQTDGEKLCGPQQLGGDCWLCLLLMEIGRALKEPIDPKQLGEVKGSAPPSLLTSPV